MLTKDEARRGEAAGAISELEPWSDVLISIC
jgi:hypothetical protein